MNSLGERIKEARKQKGLTQEELAKKIKIKNRSTLASWEINRREPNYYILNLIANTLDVSIEWLLTGKNDSNISFPNPTVKIPVLGVIRAGEPIYTDQNIIDYKDIPVTEVKDGEYFYLIVTGDSMIDNDIHPGYKVLVRKQEYAENGQIAVVLVNGEEATLKWVKYVNQNIYLLSDNPKYQLMVYNPEKVKILGIVKEVKFVPSKRR